MTTNVCACGCGEEISHPGASYAGADDATRAKHRARAAYRRRTGPVTVSGTREAMAALGLADDVTVADLAERMANVAAACGSPACGPMAARWTAPAPIDATPAGAKGPNPDPRACATSSEGPTGAGTASVTASRFPIVGLVGQQPRARSQRRGQTQGGQATLTAVRRGIDDDQDVLHVGSLFKNLLQGS